MCIVKLTTPEACKSVTDSAPRAGVLGFRKQKNTLSGGANKNNPFGAKKKIKADWRGIRTIASVETSALN